MLIYLAMLDTAEERDFFARLYEANRSLMLRKAMSLLRNHSLAEDATHNAFLRIIHHLGRFEAADSDVQRYMCLAYVTNEAEKLLRAETAHQTEPITDEETGEELLPANENPYVSAAERQRLAAAIENLEEKYRDVVIFRLVQGFSTRETANMLGISESLVATRLHRARKTLMEVLQDE